MKKILKYILLVFCVVVSATAVAQENKVGDSDDFDSNVTTVNKWEKWGPSSSSGWGLIGRLGLSLGGTMPIPFPSEIRKIDSYSPSGGLFTFGVEAYKMFSKRWGLRFGFAFNPWQGFSTSAQVKDYYTKITKEDGNVQKGWYTGKNATSVSCMSLIFPVTATFRISPRWNVSAGPYLSVSFMKKFEATISDGYLRVDDGKGPTGTKTDPGTVTTTLSDDMRTCGAGIQVCFDWKLFRHIGAFGKLDWGVTTIFPGDYETVTFKMYPVYGTIGGFYSF